MAKPKHAINLPGKEPMVLLEQYIKTLAEIKQLTQEKGLLKKRLEKLGVDPTLYTRSEYFKEYRKKNKKKLNTYHTEYREKNIEKIRAYNREYKRKQRALQKATQPYRGLRNARDWTKQ